MFDTRITHESPRYPQHIHHHRAPTDESVKLLREMEAVAEKNVVEKYTATIENNGFSGKLFEISDIGSQSTRYLVSMILNGKKVEVRLSLRDIDVALAADPRLLLTKVYAEAVAAELVKVLEVRHG